jgi:hypothetical protein
VSNEHTPGPWHFIKGASGWFVESIDFILPVGNGEESEVNARLIAAAPDMLEALRAVLTDNAQDSIEDPIGHANRAAQSTGTVFKGTLDLIRAVIAKATGEKP